MTTQEIEALKAERDALASQNKILLDALNLALPSVEACYKQHMATWETLFLLREAAKATPQQCLRDIQADAVMRAIEFFKPALDIDTEALESYAATVRQGGAE